MLYTKIEKMVDCNVFFFFFRGPTSFGWILSLLFIQQEFIDICCVPKAVGSVGDWVVNTSDKHKQTKSPVSDVYLN